MSKITKRYERGISPIISILLIIIITIGVCVLLYFYTANTFQERPTSTTGLIRVEAHKISGKILEPITLIRAVHGLQ